MAEVIKKVITAKKSHRTGIWWFGPALGFIILLAFCVMPPVEPLTPLGMKAVGVFLFTVIWWVTVNVGYPSFICIVLLILTGVLPSTEAYAASMGSWIIFFLLGCFGLSEGLRVTGFSRRFALWFLSRPFASGRPWILLAMFLLGCTVMGSIMSVTVTCIVFMAIAAAMLETLGYKKGDRFAAMFMMGIAWTATAALAMTPIAHAGNIMAMEWINRDFGYIITFPQWMIIGIPMGILVYLMILGLFRFFIRPDVARFKEMSDNYVKKEITHLGKMTTEEKYAVGIFLMVAICWMLPGLGDNLAPQLSAYLHRIGYAAPAVLGACLLCFIRVDQKPVLTFHQWMSGGVEWGSMALVAAVVVIGNVVGNPATGIPQFLTAIFEPVVLNVSVPIFLLIGMFWVVIQTNILSNLVSMTLVYNILVPIAANTGILNPVALGVTIAAASNYAFSLPSATTTTAIVIGSGWVPVAFMARYGIAMILPIILLFAFVCYPYACFILQ